MVQREAALWHKSEVLCLVELLLNRADVWKLRNHFRIFVSFSSLVRDGKKVFFSGQQLQAAYHTYYANVILIL